MRGARRQWPNLSCYLVYDMALRPKHLRMTPIDAPPISLISITLHYAEDGDCDDLRRSLTNRSAGALAPIRLASRDHVAGVSNLP